MGQLVDQNRLHLVERPGADEESGDSPSGVTCHGQLPQLEIDLVLAVPGFVGEEHYRLLDGKRRFPPRALGVGTRQVGGHRSETLEGRVAVEIGQEEERAEPRLDPLGAEEGTGASQASGVSGRSPGRFADRPRIDLPECGE
jgi:hypothetical protein